jgi:hypothetical protein
MLEYTFNEPNQRSAGVEGYLSPQKGLRGSNDAPSNHLNWDPAIRANPFRYQLRRELGKKEGKVEDGLAVIVIVRGQSQITKHVVGERLNDVSTVEL